MDTRFAILYCNLLIQCINSTNCHQCGTEITAKIPNISLAKMIANNKRDLSAINPPAKKELNGFDFDCDVEAMAKVYKNQLKTLQTRCELMSEELSSVLDVNLFFNV